LPDLLAAFLLVSKVRQPFLQELVNLPACIFAQPAVGLAGFQFSAVQVLDWPELCFKFPDQAFFIAWHRL
jgi:hypothetical protein